MRRAWWLAFALAGWIGTVIGTVAPSASAGALVAAKRPRITTETALVVWDPKTLVQHLFVAARFEEVDGPFAWWLPLPSEPKAEVVEDDLRMTFSSLIAAYRARTKRWELPTRPGGRPREALAFGGEGAFEPKVRPLPSIKAVTDTLRELGRSRDASLKDYLERYGEGRFHVVELRADPGSKAWTSPWIHLRFETSQPWYPYREPAYPSYDEDPAGERLLRVYVLTTEQVSMQHGKSVPTMAYAWLAFEPEHEEIRSALGPRLYEATGLDASRRLWLTSFEDRHVTRAGDDDLWFASAGSIPADGKPGTVGDTTEVGIALHPIDPGGRARGAEAGRARSTGVAGWEVDRVVRTRRGGRGRPGPATVFGGMAILALGIAWKLSHKGVRRR